MVALPQLPGVSHRTVAVGPLDVHVAEAGEGPPLVLLHGWPQHWWLWRDVIGPLAGRHRVIAPDLRGLGWTSAPAGGYAKEQLATDLLGLLDALGHERVTLVGHDWGGWTSLLTALRAPERVERVVALSIPHVWPTGFDPRRLLGVVHTLPLSTSSLLVPRTAEAVLKLGRTRGSYTSDELATFVDVLREPARARASVGFYRTFVTRELGPLLAGRYNGRRLEVPVTFVAGDRDPVVRWADLERTPGDSIEVVRLSGVGHFVPEEAPEAVLDAVG